MNGALKNLKRLLISGVLLLFVAHNSPGQSQVETPAGWKLISGCTVSLSVPPDIEFVYDHSIDTCYRYYWGKNIAVRIYVTPFKIGSGEYSNWLEYCVTKTKINTREAEIVSTHIPVTSEENQGLDYMTMMLVPQFRSGSGNLIIWTWSRTPEDRDQAIKILRSVQFDKK
jgi:hypothetical protein